MARTALYRHFDAADRLLYVGISDCLSKRDKQHAATAHWHHEVAYSETEWCVSRSVAVVCERQAIEKEQPKYNKALQVAQKRRPSVGSFREALLARLAAEGLTIAALARGTGVSLDALKKLSARDGASTSVETAILIADFFGETVNEFMSHRAAKSEAA